MLQSLTETFIRSRCSVFPRLDMTIDFCVKKAIIGWTELKSVLYLSI